MNRSEDGTLSVTACGITYTVRPVKLPGMRYDLTDNVRQDKVPTPDAGIRGEIHRAAHRRVCAAGV
jgi:hypothetical protein